MKKVLIFGIGGFVGQYLSQEFLDNGYEVMGSDICKNDETPSGIKIHKVDLLDYEAVKKLILEAAPDMIVNLAAISSVGRSWKMPQATMSVNVVGALNIMEAAKICNPVPKVMLIGSSEEYETSDVPIREDTPLNAGNPYGISKMTLEIFTRLYRECFGIKIYYVRPFNHTGIGQQETFVLPSFCKQAAIIERSGKAGVIKVGNLSAERDFSNVKDIVRAYRMIIESSDCTKVFNVGSGKAYSIREILDYIISLGTQEIIVEIDPERFREIDTPRICCDYSLIKAELGWEPEYSIFDTVKEMYEYYRKEQ